MTPLKQQISLIPFSIEHTGIALEATAFWKLVRSDVLYLANYRCSVWVQTSANAKIRNKSDPGFVFGLIWIQMSVKIMDTLVGVIHFAKLSSNRLLIHVIVWEMRNREMLTNVGKSPIPQWWRKWKTRIHAQIRITTKSQPLLEGHFLPVPAKFGRRPFPRSSVILFTAWQNEWKNDRERSHNILLIDGSYNNNNMLYRPSDTVKIDRQGIFN